MSDPRGAAPAAAGTGTDLERQALVALRKMRERLDAAEAARHEPLAIVGAACRFPGAPDIDAYWRLLASGGDGIVDVPPSRWTHATAGTLGLDTPTPGPEPAHGATPRARLPRRAGLLDRIDGFDAAFFGITGREAQLMDPQQRMFLELAWEALERAGIPPLALKGSRTGVFVGTTGSDYLALLAARLPQEEMDAYIVSGNTINATAGRVSYALGLHGPAMAIDTACSSSLVAIDRACRSVREGESRLAIAGGVNLILAPEIALSLARWGMLSADGRCKTFDAGADGFVRAEGCGVVLVKRLSDALADGDAIWALVRGSAVNQAGASGAFAVPNGPAQAEVMKAALAAARVNPADVGFVEAHGTGTSLGDPIEMESIAAAYGAQRGTDPARALWVGAVKSNLGHLECAAGVAGFIKTVLALRHRRIPPNLHFHQPSPHIPWSRMPVRVPTRLEELPAFGPRRLAAVSAFGFSGTNAHVVLEEAPPPVPAAVPAPPPALLLVLSARHEAALAELARRHAARLSACLGGSDPGPAPLDNEATNDAASDAATVAHCLAASTARSHLPLRLAVSAASPVELVQRLQAAAVTGTGEAGGTAPGVARGRVGLDRTGVAFLFTGQGAQTPGMGRTLASRSPVFREALERCAAVIDPLLVPHGGHGLLPVMFGDAGVPEAGRLLDRTAYTQPATFALQVALVHWWRSVGLEPSLVLGHSVGEFAAAWAAGVLSLEDAAALVARRGTLMQALPEGGAMAAVFAPEDVVRAHLDAPAARRAAHTASSMAAAGTVVVAGLNGPAETVVAGDAGAVEALVAAFAARGVRAERLAVSHAFHSPLMVPMAAPFAEAAGRIGTRPARVAAVSSMTGTAAPPDWGSARYWEQQLREPVRWLDALHSAARHEGIGIALEIGPQPVLTGLGRRALPQSPIAWLPSLRRGQDEGATVMHALGELYVRGAVDDWAGAAGATARTRADLPPYPFQHQRYWVDAPARSNAAPSWRGAAAHRGAGAAQPWGTAPPHPLLGAAQSLANGEVVFEALAGDDAHGWIRDHRIGGGCIWPAAASVEMLLAATATAAADATAAATGPVIELGDVEFRTALHLPDGAGVPLQTVVAPAAADGWQSASIHRAPDEPARPGRRWDVLVAARLRCRADAPVHADDDLAAARARCAQPVDADAFHASLAAAGAGFGPTFRRLADVRRAAEGSPREALARLLPPLDAGVAPPTASSGPGGHGDGDDWLLHPAQLDACLQLVSVVAEAATPGAEAGAGWVWIPTGIDRLVLRSARRADAGGAAWGHARLRDQGEQAAGPATGSDRLAADLTLWRDDGHVLAVVQGARFARVRTAELASPDATRTLLRDALAWTWQPLDATAPGAAAPCTWRISASAGAHQASLPAGSLAAGLAEALRQAGHTVVDAQADAGTAGVAVPVQHVVHFAHFAAAAPPAPTPPDPRSTGTPCSEADAASLLADMGREVEAVLQAVRQAGAGTGPAPRLWIVTCNAQPVPGFDPASRADPRAASLWGLARVVHAERPELHCTALDTDNGCTGPALAAALQQAAPRETQLALRGGQLLGARLAPWPPGPAPAAWRFVPPPSGRIDDLAPVPMETADPGAGEVRLEVMAAGLNFRDVLATLGMVASPAASLGGECAGRVVAVGPGVQGLAPGDEVMALAIGGMATSVNVPASFVAPLPRLPGGRRLAFGEAAALPIACLTASYGLEELARLQPGQRVLVHAGTGGVGLAAVRLAQCLGAEVLATAGSEAKRDWLRRQGVRHVFDSRQPGFAREVRAACGGAGVHVLLNALAGEFIEAGLGLVEPGGCFLEMGKRGVWSAERVTARFPGIRYHVFDLGEAAAAQPGLAQRLFDRLLQRLGRGDLAPLPATSFEMRDARAAFHTMAQARHVGKLVLLRDASAPPLPLRLRGDAAYLVTGGFGALGLQVAAGLVERGARSLVLMGRSPPGADGEALLARLAAAGAVVQRVLGDVGDAAAVRSALEGLDGRPLRGVVHCAGVIDDATLGEQDAARLQRVLRPKLAGALAVAAATAGQPLDFLVLFSAGAGWIGHAGQANYAAANTAIDVFAQTLRATGVPATAIAWGRWAGGMGAAGVDWAARGIGEVTPATGLAAMFALVERQAASVAWLPMDWPMHLRKVHGREPPACFDLVATAGAHAHSGSTGGTDATPPETRPLARLQSLPAHRRREALQQLVEQEVRQVAGLGAAVAIDATWPLRELGLDSLMSVELRNALGAQFGCTLPATLLFDHPTLHALTEHLLSTLPGLAEAAGAGAGPAGSARDADATKAAADTQAVAALSDEEAEAQLLAELAQGSSR